MTDAEMSNRNSLLPFLPKEPGLLAHVQRVAALAMVAAGNAGYSREDAESAHLAGLLHHYERDDLGAAQAAKLWTAVGMEVPAGVRVMPEEASRALRGFRQSGGSPNWSGLVEAANTFDEEMEALPYGDVSTALAVRELCHSGIVPQEFVAALASFRVVSREQLSAFLNRLPDVSGAVDGNALAQKWLGSMTDEALHRHALEVAEAAAESLPACAKTYLAGLLHDVGRLAFLPPRIGARLREWTDRGFPVCYAEFLISGTDHAALGADLLRNRNFAETIAEGVEFHHRPELTDSRIAAAIYMAEDVDESLPSCARDHLSSKRLASSDGNRAASAGRT